MTYDEYLEWNEVHDDYDSDTAEWYEQDERESDQAGQCIECGSEYTLVSFDPASHTNLFECYDCGSMWDQWRCQRD